MKNKEKYMDEILEAFSGQLLKVCDFRKKHIVKEKICTDFINCTECCKRTREWLEEEYREPVKLSDDEIVILKNISKDYQWIARNFDVLEIFENKPFKVKVEEAKGWLWNFRKGYSDNIRPFSHLFNFIDKEDKEPYNIDDLLRQNGVDR